MLTRTATHALGVLRHLVRHPDQRLPAEALARETGIPANYLSKILNQLRKRQIVEGEKGRGGGFRVLPAALDRPIGDIVEIFEGLDTVSQDTCIFGLERCDDANPCALHPFARRIRAVRDELLTTTRVRDLPGHRSQPDAPRVGGKRRT